MWVRVTILFEQHEIRIHQSGPPHTIVLGFGTAAQLRHFGYVGAFGGVVLTWTNFYGHGSMNGLVLQDAIAQEDLTPLVFRLELRGKEEFVSCRY